MAGLLSVLDFHSDSLWSAVFGCCQRCHGTSLKGRFHQNGLQDATQLKFQIMRLVPDQ